jgi:hypothetical protein
MRRKRSYLRPLGVAFVICGLLIVATGSGAFSTVASQRQSSIAVADPSSAYFGISTTKSTVLAPTPTPTPKMRGNGKVVVQGTTSSEAIRASTSGTDTPDHTRKKTIVIGTVTNRFASDLTWFDITVTKDAPGGITVSNVSVATIPLAASSSSDLTATVKCLSGARTTETVTLDIEARGPNIRFSTTQTVQVTCAGLPSQGNKTTATTAPPNQPTSLIQPVLA